MWLTWADRFIFSIYWFTNSFHFHFFNPKLANQTTFSTKARPQPSLLQKKRFKKTLLTRRAKMIQNWYYRYNIFNLKSFHIFVIIQDQTRKLVVLQPIWNGVIWKSGHSGVTWERSHFGQGSLCIVFFFQLILKKLDFFLILFLFPSSKWVLSSEDSLKWPLSRLTPLSREPSQLTSLSCDPSFRWLISQMTTLKFPLSQLINCTNWRIKNHIKILLFTFAVVKRVELWSNYSFDGTFVGSYDLNTPHII